VAGWLALAGLLLMIAALVITLSVEVPIDNLIGSWTEGTLPANWQQTRAQWATFHTLRTFLSLGAVAAAVGAGLSVRTGDRDASRSQVVQADHATAWSLRKWSGTATDLTD
jgi:hypothetical protein